MRVTILIPIWEMLTIGSLYYSTTYFGLKEVGIYIYIVKMDKALWRRKSNMKWQNACKLASINIWMMNVHKSNVLRKLIYIYIYSIPCEMDVAPVAVLWYRNCVWKCWRQPGVVAAICLDRFYRDNPKSVRLLNRLQASVPGWSGPVSGIPSHQAPLPTGTLCRTKQCILDVMKSWSCYSKKLGD